MAQSRRHPTATGTVIRITAMVTATPLTVMVTDTPRPMPLMAMATRLMATVMGPAITAVTEPPITRSAAISTPIILSGVTGVTKFVVTTFAPGDDAEWRDC